MTTITGSYKNHVFRNPDKIAIQTATEAINYRDWYKIVCQTANWLHSIAGSNKKIGILMPNSIPFLQLFTGAAMAGLVAVPLDAKWKPAELKQRLAVSSPTVIITTEKLAKRIEDIDSNIIIWGNASEQISKNESAWNEKIEDETPFYMGFTSGTTGVPKAFVRTHDSWVESFACNRHDFHLNQSDHVLIPGALIHSHFLYGAVSTLYLGGTIYLMEKFSPKQTLRLIETSPITVLYVVPTMVEAMLLEKIKVHKPMKIISSGAKWEEYSKQKIREQFLHLTMFEFYGASELSYVSVLCSDDYKNKPGSVGKPCHNVEIQIRPGNSEMSKIGGIGKIFVKSNMLISGYIHSNSRNIQSIRDEDGWATVDDLGYLDEDGFLHIVGREKNMILYGGVNVFPEEIESVLMSHPNVEEAAIVGEKDPYWGQIPVAVIKGNASKMELKKLCKETLSSYKLPRKWVFVEEFPYTTSGKIARMRVKQLIENEVKIH